METNFKKKVPKALASRLDIVQILTFRNGRAKISPVVENPLTLIHTIE